MVPYVRAANIGDGVLRLDDVKEMNFTPNEQSVFALRPGDVLVTEGSGSLATVGASAVWQGEIPGTVCFQNTLLRMRPRDGQVDPRFLAWWSRANFANRVYASIASGANIYHLSAERVRALPLHCPPVDEQRRIADFLDAETARIDQLVNAQLRVIDLLEERANARILKLIGQSTIVDRGGTPVVALRRVIEKLNRPALPTTEVITAYRDGQVTLRSIRRSEGYTLSANDRPQGQGVETGDIVIHGLDGFAGAIGDAEASGNCSPVYHVCRPIDGGNSAFYGRLLKILALNDYLALYGASARERAVDFRNWQIFGHAPLPQVEPAVQHEIGDLITKARPLREKVKRFNERLAERKQALITAAVTGQIDVTTAGGVTA